MFWQLLYFIIFENIGYSPRPTSGRVDCRPKIFKKDIFQQNNFLCNFKCLYYIFCMEENKQISFVDRIKQLRLSFQKPYYFFSIMENGEIMIVFENEKGEKVSFREKTMVGVVQKAEDYLVASQIRSGQQAKIEGKKEAPEAPEAPVDTPTEEDDGIEIKTTIRDSEGNKHPEL